MEAGIIVRVRVLMEVGIIVRVLMEVGIIVGPQAATTVSGLFQARARPIVAAVRVSGTDGARIPTELVGSGSDTGLEEGSVLGVRWAGDLAQIRDQMVMIKR
eukprot:TRINITY_DN121_c0_g1_i3.p2 TRINITY_DN121_c0_g1~~TRINITY_DN121_c0_g1_i3.p2  ORF type:complete len:102 (-),score=5.25 TRINITY_DN121_c0_g1_i3:639-944(-)